MVVSIFDWFVVIRFLIEICVILVMLLMGLMMCVWFSESCVVLCLVWVVVRLVLVCFSVILVLVWLMVDMFEFFSW